MNENITMKMLIEDWNIKPAEIDVEVKRNDIEKEGSPFYARDEKLTIEEKKFYAVRKIANERIEKLNERIGKEMKTFKAIHCIIPFAIIALSMSIAFYFFKDIAIIIIISMVGAIFGSIATAIYDNIMFSILKKKYPWWYRRGGLYFDNIGQYYGEQMPAT